MPRVNVISLPAGWAPKGVLNAVLRECVHEREVLDLVLADRWPERSDAEIVEHAAHCDVCTEVIAVALAMREDEGSLPGSQKSVKKFDKTNSLPSARGDHR